LDGTSGDAAEDGEVEDELHRDERGQEAQATPSGGEPVHPEVAREGGGEHQRWQRPAHWSEERWRRQRGEPQKGEYTCPGP